MKEIVCSPRSGSYTITVGKGLLQEANRFLDLNRKVLIVTDDGVPQGYAERVVGACKEGEIFRFPQGEQSKSLQTLECILQKMLQMHMTRKDCVVAVGGGVVGDITGLAASLYMRGVDFYNIPTTLLSAVDSSVGGKTAVDFCGVKNIVGTFYQPKGVLISVDTLETLEKRQLLCGLVESLKMAACLDIEFFEYLEQTDITGDTLEEIIFRAVKIKSQVVEQDEKEKGLRKVLNFGHTIGHGIEASCGLLHGECVAIGMLPMCGENARKRIEKTLKKWGIPTRFDADKQAVYEYALHDKKSAKKGVDVVLVDEIGTFRIENVAFEALKERIEKL